MVIKSKTTTSLTHQPIQIKVDIMCRPQPIPKPSSIVAPWASPLSSNKLNEKARRSPKQNNNKRRCRRSTIKKSDESTDTSCTHSTVPSDESLDISLENHNYTNSPLRKSRRRPRKSKATSPKAPKQVQINELTSEEKAQYIAIDAEMVGILDKNGRQHSALARISLVDWNGEPIFDSYVRVTDPIVDYRTFVSGIRPQDLQSQDALPILEVRRIVGGYIHNKVVVGHGLKNDFKALGLSHPWYLIRDSAKYLPFMKPSITNPHEMVAKKLKTLAHDKLGMTIQNEGEAHDPAEDAVAAMELYKKHRVKWEKVMKWKLERTRGIEEMHLNVSFEFY